MLELEEQVNQLINQILLKAENQHELLIGQCRSQVKLTNTQEHILMLLLRGERPILSWLRLSMSARLLLLRQLKPWSKRACWRLRKTRMMGA